MNESTKKIVLTVIKILQYVLTLVAGFFGGAVASKAAELCNLI